MGGQSAGQQSIKVDKDQGVWLANGPLMSDELVVDARPAVKNVMVWLAPIEAGQIPITRTWLLCPGPSGSSSNPVASLCRGSP